MWPRVINIVLGVWLMIAPAVLNYAEPASVNDRIIGPLVAAFAAMAISEVLRPVRRVNLILGMWLIIAPLILRYPDLAPIVNNMVVGVGVLLTALSKGKERQKRIGGGWSILWKDPKKPQKPAPELL